MNKQELYMQICGVEGDLSFNLHSKDRCNIGMMHQGFTLEVSIVYFEKVYIKHQPRNKLVLVNRKFRKD